MSSEAFGIREISDISPSNVCDTAKAAIGGTTVWKGDSYTYVFNGGNSEIPPGFGVIITATSGYTVTVSSLSGITPCFGVVRHATISTGDYGFVQTNGFCPLEADADTALSAGDNVVLGDDGVHTRKTAAGNYLANAHGYMQDTAASGASAIAFINCFS